MVLTHAGDHEPGARSPLARSPGARAGAHSKGALGMGGPLSGRRSWRAPPAWMPDQFNPANAGPTTETTRSLSCGGTRRRRGRWWREWVPAAPSRRGPLSEGAEPPPSAGWRSRPSFQSLRHGPGPIRSRVSAGRVLGTPDNGVVDEVVAVTGDEAMPPPESWPVPRGAGRVSPGRRFHAARILAQRPDMGARPSRWCSPILASATSSGLFA